MSLTIKDLVFEYVTSRNGVVEYDELTQLIISKFPDSEWKKTHWAWYKTQITSPRGKYYSHFSETIRTNLSGSQSRYRTSTDYSQRERSMKNSEIFIFEDYSKQVEFEIASALAKVSYHIHPVIVEKIVADNVEFKTHLLDLIKDNELRSDFAETFFYKESDCVFPGVRRPVNFEKNGNSWKRNLNVKDLTILDDNTFPRHIWAFLSMNKMYEGKMWSASGLSNFELAHIFGHKSDEKNLEKKVFSTFNESKKPYACFTSASNVVLIPKGLMKPTDTFEAIKIAFYKRHIDLYGERNLLLEKGFNNKYVPEWYPDLHWQEPLLPDDWEQKIDNLLSYRRSFLTSKYINKQD